MNLNKLLKALDIIIVTLSWLVFFLVYLLCIRGILRAWETENLLLILATEILSVVVVGASAALLWRQRLS